MNLVVFSLFAALSFLLNAAHACHIGEDIFFNVTTHDTVKQEVKINICGPGIQTDAQHSVEIIALQVCSVLVHLSGVKRAATR